MSAPTAIGRVSESLRNLLLGEMQLTPSVNVTILAPDESGGQRRINLFLYKVRENEFLRNQGWQVNPANTSQLMPAPLALNLYYLITPFANNDGSLGNATRHELLGDAMRVFHEFPVVPDEYLAGDLVSAREQIRIVQNGLDMEELSQVWSTFSQPFRLSVLYEVSVVQLDQTPAQQRALPERVRQVGVPDVRAPFSPPVVTGLEPAAGPAGTVITFSGDHLDGWTAYVTLLRQRIVDDLAITGDSFQATIPPGLAPGFYQLRVDISHLHRSMHFFEVTV
jgi:hypothetical protein